MKKILTVVTIFLGLTLAPKPALALTEAGGSAVLRTRSSENQIDPRVEKLENYLKQHHSPLADYSQVFVTEADRYQIEWKLVPAITGLESSFGKRIPYNSYNAYGWANGNYYFDSWEQSIKHVTRVLKEKYYDRGLDTVSKIAPVYAPPSDTWTSKVNFFMNKIDSFSNTGSLEQLSLTI
ncbi:hypothetical protein ACFL0Y_01225 [Patescibacteria group bacterium]